MSIRNIFISWVFYMFFVPLVPILTSVDLNVFHALKDINQIKKVLLFVKNVHLELIHYLARLNAFIAQKEIFRRRIFLLQNM